MNIFEDMDKLKTDRIATLQVSLKLNNPEEVFKYKIFYTRDCLNQTVDYSLISEGDLANTNEWLTIVKENVVLKSSAGYKIAHLKVTGPGITSRGTPPDYFMDNVVLDLH